MKTGKFRQIFGTDKQHNPLDRVGQLQGAKLPRMWILHGEDDTGVPADGAISFARELERNGAASVFKLDIIDDEPSEHGFDRTWTMKDEKLTERLDWINEIWLE